MREISVTELQVTPQMIGNEWWLVTAGDEAKGYNTMTASWGHVGVIWQRPTAIVYIRPQRYTKEFVDRADRYTLSLFGGGYKKRWATWAAIRGVMRIKSPKSVLLPYLKKTIPTLRKLRLWSFAANYIRRRCFPPDLSTQESLTSIILTAISMTCTSAK